MIGDILNRTPEAAIFPYCREHRIATIVRGPLAMGILTGKFTAETRFGKDEWRARWRENPDEFEVFMNDLEKVAQLRPLAKGRNLAPLAPQFAIAHPAATTTIPGAKTMAQLKENIAALGCPALTREEMTRIDAVTPPGGGRRIWPA